ncbi:RNA-binding cell elongation regulator Jag/EloR [Pseudoramibacter faecis]|uniref:RNA-binding cell elongation regulator Jag/EloR n=1 Tax=Pseudoramibacter faecis TaxID=3108534 RepID=UPI002E773FCD|nr:RNA-binding cell elongation regulator Jag/EloR [Pseudoramibacter sp. HA2172]
MEAKGKTVSEALRKALTALGLTEDQVDVRVVQKPEFGVLGIFGKKEAVIEVTPKNVEARPPVAATAASSEVPTEAEADVNEAVADMAEINAYLDDEAKAIQTAAKRFLKDMITAMALEVAVTTDYDRDNDVLHVELAGPKMGILIGRRGQTLDAIQYLTSLAVNKTTDHYVRVLIDTEHYREKRQGTLEHLAHKMADKAVRYHKKMVLEPMNPGERRIIHATLQDSETVYTYSEGHDPYRHVVIDLKENQDRKD